MRPESEYWHVVPASERPRSVRRATRLLAGPRASRACHAARPRPLLPDRIAHHGLASAVRKTPPLRIPRDRAGPKRARSCDRCLSEVGSLLPAARNRLCRWRKQANLAPIAARQAFDRHSNGPIAELPGPANALPSEGRVLPHSSRHLASRLKWFPAMHRMAPRP